MQRDNRDIGYQYDVTNAPGAPHEVCAMKPLGVDPKTATMENSARMRSATRSSIHKVNIRHAKNREL